MRSKQKRNYLDGKPRRREGLTWSEEDGRVTLAIENTGIWNRLFQKLLKKPKVSYIHLDDMGSFIWPLLDGDKTVAAIGEAVEERFGEKAAPLYERLAQYVQILESYRFVTVDF